MNFDYRENGGKKSFLINLKEHYRVSQCGEQDYNANNEKNGDYYKIPSLSQFTDEL